MEIIGDSRSLERAFGRSAKAGNTFGKTMAKVGKVAAVGLAGGLLAAGFALRRGFAEIAEGQKVAAQTGAVLRSTGAAANVTAKQISKLATSLSRMTGIDDEAIQGMENILLTFTGIKNEVGKGNDIFNQATKATLDMATALGMDFNSAAIMVGKALNQMDVTTQGNVRGFMALRRVGVLITPQMMAQAAALIKSGRAMEAQKLLLKELNTEFGGSAKAFGTTLPGAMGKLTNAFDEIMAAFAQGFLPVILKVANVLTTKLADPNFVARVQQLGTLIGTRLFNALKAVGQWFDTHWDSINAGFNTTVGIIRAMAAVVRAVTVAVLRMANAVLTALSGILTAGASLPLIGGKFKGPLEAVNTARESARAAIARRTGGNRRRTGVYAPGSTFSGPGRASGGSVMRGVAYTVGERGPETFVPGSSGTILPNGGRGGDVVINLDGREIARVSLNHITRMGKRGASQQRGRLGGQNLALS